MKTFSLAFLSVGLCFYAALRAHFGLDVDGLAALMSLLSAVGVFFFDNN